MAHRHRRTLIIALIAAALMTAAAPIWLPQIARFLVVADPLAPGDALVPLAGGDDRLRYAAELYRQDYASRLVITDLNRTGPAGSLESLGNIRLAVEVGVPLQRLYRINRRVHSTYTELQAVRDLAEREGWHSLIVVTSPQHTRRARMIAERVFHGSNILVSVRPVAGQEARVSRWWEYEGTRAMTVMEYVKLLALLSGYQGR